MHACVLTQTHKSTKYYSSCKIALVTRDPRDQFVEIKHYKGVAITMNSANPVPYVGMYYGNGSENVVISSITQQLQSQ